ncbi:MAG: hypothetical protein M1825_001127 [Sarcosagium campestre]|nr:MAG: hypothetical protein M1825_001127 [Sarcosagium campestre]
MPPSSNYFQLDGYDCSVRRSGKRQAGKSSSKSLRNELRGVLERVTASTARWEADHRADSPSAWRDQFSDLHNRENTSLFYLFNTLASPAPRLDKVEDRHARRAMEDILYSENCQDGLKTQLYPYQRESAALMLQRESAPSLMPDPRFERIQAPDGSSYLFDAQTYTLLRHEVKYEEPQGGILAETMGLGKSLICLALITATKGHMPRIPVQYSTELTPVRNKVGSLTDMCAATIGRLSVPWKAQLDIMQDTHGVDLASCREILHRNHPASYFATMTEGERRNRGLGPAKWMRLAWGTIIICPANLLQQWESEIKKHCSDVNLSLMVVTSYNNYNRAVTIAELCRVDILLMSRDEFDLILKRSAWQDHEGQPAARSQFCERLELVHWKRIILDEGHVAGGSPNTLLNTMARRITAECRWVVSGTPTSGLIGVEVGLAAAGEHGTEDKKTMAASVRDALNGRKWEDPLEAERRDLRQLGNIVSGFLMVKPWATVSSNKDAVSWNRYVQAQVVQDRIISSHCLRATLEALIVKHRFEDIDVVLPPLHNRIVRLEPSFYDRLRINLFLAVITVNSITSEREGVDYLFDPKNRTVLNQLVNNLRQGGFLWTAFQDSEVRDFIDNAMEYLSEEHVKCSMEDRQLLRDAIEAGETALRSAGWQSFSRYHELGFSVTAFPESAVEYWALDGHAGDPVLMGATQVMKAQQHVNSKLHAPDPSEGLAGIGISAMSLARRIMLNKRKKKGSNTLGVPESSLVEYQDMRKQKRHPQLPAPHIPENGRKQTVNGKGREMPPPDSPLKRKAAEIEADDSADLPADSTLVKTQLTGVASAKMAYLLDRIRSVEQTEKTLIFYEGDDIAYYVSQALDIAGIPHLIYARTLSTRVRAQYLVSFNGTETFRVLLMDVRQAAFGLNLSSASRVFFVNPLWQPNIEAQAIKRAHRIGQSRPVIVETLVLRDTLEDAMLQRRKAMTHQEHEGTQHSLLDDSTMKTLIQNARFLPIDGASVSAPAATLTAPLRSPQPIFGRRVKHFHRDQHIANADLGTVGIVETSIPSVSETSSDHQMVGDGLDVPETPSNGHMSRDKKHKVQLSFAVQPASESAPTPASDPSEAQIPSSDAAPRREAQPPPPYDDEDEIIFDKPARKTKTRKVARC